MVLYRFLEARHGGHTRLGISQPPPQNDYFHSISEKVSNEVVNDLHYDNLSRVLFSSINVFRVFTAAEKPRSVSCHLGISCVSKIITKLQKAPLSS